MKRILLMLALYILALGLVCGCSFVRSPNRSLSDFVEQLNSPTADAEDANSNSNSELRIANPPAKTIRFGGSEVLLGSTEAKQIAADKFWQHLTTRLNDEKYFSARQFVEKSFDTAEQVLWERWATEPNGKQLRFIANILSQDLSSDVAWNGLLDYSTAAPTHARRYLTARTQFLKSIQQEEPSTELADQLRSAAQDVKHSLVQIDALHLLALGEYAFARHSDAASHLMQAIELAEENQDGRRSADLWLMAAINSGRSIGQTVESASAWKKAVDRHARYQSQSDVPLSVAFWLRANQHKPASAVWPDSTKHALLDYAKSVGCRLTDQSPAELVIWIAVGRSQLSNGKPQLALVSFKKAETSAVGDNIMWLRIAQSECLAALGQNRAATTLLCGPLASKHAVIPFAASAALGSAKLKAGTFEQGAQLLSKALNNSPKIDWPTRSEAEADLALAMLILGETDHGLEALHSAQRTFESEGNISSLLLSLENEKRLLEHEGKSDAAESIRLQMLAIEKSAAAGKARS